MTVTRDRRLRRDTSVLGEVSGNEYELSRTPNDTSPSQECIRKMLAAASRAAAAAAADTNLSGLVQE